MSSSITPAIDEPNWQFSDLDAALAEARATGMPVFAYWGTGWCPPCAEMRATVFRTPEFRARSDRVVLLGVDGDMPLAQTVGDRLGTTVYPTMLLLDGSSAEWLRFPGGLPADVFCEMLDLALRKRMPISAIATRLLDGQSLEADDFRLLAFHYWPQDQRAYWGDMRLALLEKLDAQVPPQLEREAARIFIWRLLETATRHATNSAAVSTATRQHLHKRLLDLLNSTQATYATLYYLIVGVHPVLDLIVPRDDSSRQRLVEALRAGLNRLLDSATLSATERLITLSTHADLARRNSPSGELDAATRERVRTTVERVDSQTTWAVERQSVVNMAGHLLKQCDFRREAEALFRKAAEEAIGPTYFMPYLAEMCIEENRTDEALTWWRRAFEETQGKNTRFALGVRYITALTKHFPDRSAEIEALTARVLGELGDDPDLTRSRNGNTLRQLSNALKSWRR